MASFKFTTCQEHALSLLESPKNVFLTGFAGTGKSFLVRKFISGLDLKTFPVLASTGAAAVLIGGRTFHSFFGLGIFEGGFFATVQRASEDKRVRNRIKKIEGFILDEVSMISGVALNAAEVICRNIRAGDLPWGGLKVVVVGDFAQLPPVDRSNQNRDWAFLSEAWESANFVSACLTETVRTTDSNFVRVLNDVRNGLLTDDLREFLEKRLCDDPQEYRDTCLFPRREQVEQYNRGKLSEIDDEQIDFATKYQGRERDREQLKKQMPIPEILSLKKSATVMIRINDPNYRYINGTTGVVEGFAKDTVLVRLKNRKLVEIEKNIFALQNGDGEVVATAENFPLTLAYAMTIHKSQGSTLSDALVDLRGLWEPGQAYVALSRLQNSDGLKLLGWSESSIKADPKVVQFQSSVSPRQELPYRQGKFVTNAR